MSELNPGVAPLAIGKAAKRIAENSYICSSMYSKLWRAEQIAAILEEELPGVAPLETQPSKRFFLDTEFIESGPKRPIELLSVGIVCEDGREFYAANADANLANANPWVMENVVPHLGKPHQHMGFDSIRRSILDFVGDCKPEFWGYYADYDWVVFCQIFGTMMDLPKGWPMYCRDIKQLCADKGDAKLPEQTSAEHNALNDARWNVEAYKFLKPGTAQTATPSPTEKKQLDKNLTLG